MEQKVFTELKKIIKERFKKDVELTTRFSETGIDSLTLLDLIVETEEIYNITISDEELVSMETMEDVVKAIASKL